MPGHHEAHVDASGNGSALRSPLDGHAHSDFIAASHVVGVAVKGHRCSRITEAGVWTLKKSRTLCLGPHFW